MALFSSTLFSITQSSPEVVEGVLKFLSTLRPLFESPLSETELSSFERLCVPTLCSFTKKRKPCLSPLFDIQYQESMIQDQLCWKFLVLIGRLSKAPPFLPSPSHIFLSTPFNNELHSFTKSPKIHTQVTRNCKRPPI
jgi:hypothetical protein